MVQQVKSKVLFDPTDPAGINPISQAWATEWERRLDLLYASLLAFLLPLLHEAYEERKLPDGVQSGVDLLENVHVQNEYDFPKRTETSSKFRRFLEEQVDMTLVGAKPRLMDGWITAEDWSQTFVRSAFREGMVRSYLEGRTGSTAAVQGAFDSPISAARLHTVFTRDYAKLKHFTQEMSDNLNTILAQDMSKGLPAHSIAAHIQQDLNLNRVRARRIARTETAHAHAEATLLGYEMQGIIEVGAVVEFLTAGDSGVCDLCAMLEGQVYSLMEASGVIPVHPNCRCVWIPSFTDAEDYI